MIIINSSKVIEITSSKIIKKDMDSLFCNSEELPAIDFGIRNDGAYCGLKYINKDGTERKTSYIQIGHVYLKYIFIMKREYDEKTRFSESNKVTSYFLSVVFYLDGVKDCLYEIHSSEFTTLKEIGKREQIVSLFSFIIPLINFDIDNGIPATDLNIYFYEQKYKDKGKEYASYETNPYYMSIDDALNIIYKAKVKIIHEKPNWYSTDDMSCYASLESEVGIIYNKYFAELIGAIIHAEIKKEYRLPPRENVTYLTSAIMELPTYVKYDVESLRRYVLRELYVGVLLNCKQEKLNTGFKHSAKIKDCKRLCYDIKIVSLLNFVLGLKATCYKDGKTRVGRDDEGWMEYTILFPIEFGYCPTKYLIGIINEVLNVKLEKQDDNLCYYYRYTTEPENIGYFEYREEYWSDDYQRKCLHLILKKIVPMLYIEKGREALLEDTK